MTFTADRRSDLLIALQRSQDQGVDYDQHELDVIRDAIYDVPIGHAFTERDLSGVDFMDGSGVASDVIVQMALDFYGLYR